MDGHQEPGALKKAEEGFVRQKFCCRLAVAFAQGRFLK